jgi:hypothetical protein
MGNISSTFLRAVRELIPLPEATKWFTLTQTSAPESTRPNRLRKKKDFNDKARPGVVHSNYYLTPAPVSWMPYSCVAEHSSNIYDYILMSRDDEVLVYQQRLDAEWLALNAVREMLGIANRGGADSTYLDALAIGRKAAPQLFDPQYSLIAAGQEPPLVREYRERAKAKSIVDGQEVSPLELLDGDLSSDELLLKAGGGSYDQLKRSVAALRRARDWFQERVFSEHKLISRDVYTAHRPELPNPPRPMDNYIEFALPFNRALRIRLLHPDKPEYSTGADLVYEICEEDDRLARIAFVQYKIWDGQTLRFSEAGSLPDQLRRLEDLCCKSGLCTSPDSTEPPSSYRLPHCTAFLRPTDRLQRADATLISSGVHVPVCVTLTMTLSSMGGRILRKDPIRSSSVSQRIFEELFNRNMLGSRWLSYEEVEDLYKTHSILERDQTIIVHAQEFKV